MSVRSEKVASEIKHQINEVLSKNLTELQLGLVTVTKVRLTDDLQLAKIYISLLGNKQPADECIEKINNRKRQIRMHLASRLKLKNMPDLIFHYDDTMDYVVKIEELIKEIHKNENDKL